MLVCLFDLLFFLPKAIFNSDDIVFRLLNVWAVLVLFDWSWPLMFDTEDFWDINFLLLFEQGKPLDWFSFSDKFLDFCFCFLLSLLISDLSNLPKGCVWNSFMFSLKCLAMSLFEVISCKLDYSVSILSTDFHFLDLITAERLCINQLYFWVINIATVTIRWLFRSFTLLSSLDQWFFINVIDKPVFTMIVEIDKTAKFTMPFFNLDYVWNPFILY